MGVDCRPLLFYFSGLFWHLKHKHWQIPWLVPTKRFCQRTCHINGKGSSPREDGPSWTPTNFPPTTLDTFLRCCNNLSLVVPLSWFKSLTPGEGKPLPLYGRYTNEYTNNSDGSYPLMYLEINANCWALVAMVLWASAMNCFHRCRLKPAM